MHAEAFKRGVNELFDACIGEAESAGFKVEPRPTGLKMTKARPDGTRGLLALFLDRSEPQNGITSVSTPLGSLWRPTSFLGAKRLEPDFSTPKDTSERRAK